MKTPFVFKINFVPVFQFIKKLFHKEPLLSKSYFAAEKRALFFAINKYGGGHDLNGCINDQTDFIAKLNKDFPGFDIRAWKDKEVTRVCFILECTKAIQALRPDREDVLLIHYSGHGTQVPDKHGDDEDGYDEGLYLIDGVVIDDDIAQVLKSIPDKAVVILMFDSCFSGTITRELGDDHQSLSKFVPMPEQKLKTKKLIRIPKQEMKWVVFSGCRENQTSADAFIKGRYNGAFTYYALKTLKSTMSYADWSKNITVQVLANNYEQVPTLEGKSSLFDRKVFI
jgi:hypothetical protein